MRLKASSFWILPILASLVAIGPLSTDMYLPAQPSIKNEMGASLEEIQLTLSIFLVGVAIALPFWGPLADRYGRLKIIFAGVVLFMGSSLGCALSENIETLIFFRFLQSIGACVGPTIGRTVVRDIYGNEKAASAFGYLATIMALAPAVAPVIGSLLLELWDWRAIFLMLAGISMISTFLYHYFIGETLDTNFRQSISFANIVNNYKSLSVNRSFMGYTLIMSCTFSGLFAFISAASFIFIEFLELTPQQFSWCFIGMVAGFMTGSSSGARLSGNIPITRMILTGACISTLAGLLCLSLSLMEIFHPLSVVIPVAFYAMGTGLVLPQCNAASLRNFPHMAGTASSLTGIIQNTLAAIGGIGVAHLHSDSPTTMAIFMCAGGGLALVCFFLVLPVSERRQHAHPYQSK